MVATVTSKEVGNISNGAFSVCAILAGARDPTKVVQDMNFAHHMGKAKETSWNDRDDIVPGTNPPYQLVYEILTRTKERLTGW